VRVESELGQEFEIPVWKRHTSGKDLIVKEALPSEDKLLGICPEGRILLRSDV